MFLLCNLISITQSHLHAITSIMHCVKLSFLHILQIIFSLYTHTHTFFIGCFFLSYYISIKYLILLLYTHTQAFLLHTVFLLYYTHTTLINTLKHFWSILSQRKSSLVVFLWKRRTSSVVFLATILFQMVYIRPFEIILWPKKQLN